MELKKILSEMFSKLKYLFLFLFPPTRIKMELEKEKLESKYRAKLDCWICHQPAGLVPKKEYQYPKTLRILFGYVGGSVSLLLLIFAFFAIISLTFTSMSTSFGSSSEGIAIGLSVALFDGLFQGFLISLTISCILSASFLGFMNYFFTKKKSFYSCEKCEFQMDVKTFSKPIAEPLPETIDVIL